MANTYAAPDLYDDGTVTICDKKNVAEDGDMPSFRLVPVFTEFYTEKSIGMNRVYLAMGADQQLDMLIRIPGSYRPWIGQHAVVYSAKEDLGDNLQFRITAVQPATDSDGMRVYDLSLERLSKNYDFVSQ